MGRCIPFSQNLRKAFRKDEPPLSYRRLASFFINCFSHSKFICPTLRYLARQLGYSMWTVSKAVSYLKKIGFLDVKNRGRKSNRYFINNDLKKPSKKAKNPKTIAKSDPKTTREYNNEMSELHLNENKGGYGDEDNSSNYPHPHIPGKSKNIKPQEKLQDILALKPVPVQEDDILDRLRGYQFWDLNHTLLLDHVLERWVRCYGLELVNAVITAYEVDYKRKIRVSSGRIYRNGEAWCEGAFKRGYWKSVLHKELNRLEVLKHSSEKSWKRLFRWVKDGCAMLLNGTILELDRDPNLFKQDLKHYIRYVS